MQRFRLLVALVTSAVMFASPMVAQATTVSVTPTSDVTFSNNYSQRSRFDGLGRLWVWNTASSSSDPSSTPIAKVYAKSGGTWSEAMTFAPKKVGVFELRFASDGTGYVTNFRQREIDVVKLASDGSTKKMQRFKYRGRTWSMDAFPGSDNKLYVLFPDRIDVFRLPLKKSMKPTRTITNTFHSYSQLVVPNDGNIVVSAGDTSSGAIRVFTPGQSGRVDADHAFQIDTSYDTYRYVSDLALTPEGTVAVAYWYSGVAIFPSTANSLTTTPSTWYPQSSPVSNLQGVDFSSSGAMSEADYLATPNIKVYFEDGCAPRSHRGC
jgi:hypothetical protein